MTFHDAYMDRERGRVCMVMEYMNGGTLQQFVTGRQALSEPALAGVARSVLRGLAEMHAQRKIHRDIKPSNILLDRQGRVRISDFGLVRELNETGSFAQTFTGTVTYMSPERIQDTGHGCPSDIWSLGMVRCLYLVYVVCCALCVVCCVRVSLLIFFGLPCSVSSSSVSIDPTIRVLLAAAVGMCIHLVNCELPPPPP